MASSPGKPNMTLPTVNVQQDYSHSIHSSGCSNGRPYQIMLSRNANLTYNISTNLSQTLSVGKVQVVLQGN